MFCPHCAYKIDENKVNAKSKVFDDSFEAKDDFEVTYICPQCGHIIKSNLNDKEIKSLSGAAHAQIQRGSNRFAQGMGMLCLGVIALIIAFIFFLLANKPNSPTIVTTCAEFYVFLALLITSVILLVIGGIFSLLGFKKKKMYSNLLKDIYNETFVQ